MLDEILLVFLFDGLFEIALYVIQLYCFYVFEESYQMRESEFKQKYNNLMLSFCVWLMQFMINRIYCDCSFWLKVLWIYRIISSIVWVILKFCMDLFGFVRK